MKALKTIGFWVLSLTWGLPMTLFGAIIALGLLVTGHKPKMFGYFIHFSTRTNDGWGMSGGLFIFTTNDCKDDIQLLSHECGHSSYQQLWFGWLFPFIVGIPSAIRYLYREYLVKSGKKKYSDLPPYDSIWFEKTATEYGAKFVEKMINDGVLKNYE